MINGRKKKTLASYPKQPAAAVQMTEPSCTTSLETRTNLTAHSSVRFLCSVFLYSVLSSRFFTLWIQSVARCYPKMPERHRWLWRKLFRCAATGPKQQSEEEKKSETAERLEMKHHKSEIILFVNFTEFSLLRAIPVRPGMLVPFGSVLTSERGLASHPPLYTPCGRGAVRVCLCACLCVCSRRV